MMKFFFFLFTLETYQDGRIETVSNETGYRITPTVVGYTGTEKV